MTRHSLIARAPTRLDFGGGWTDVPPYSDEQGGCVCNLAIARHATVRVSAGPAGEVADVDAESAPPAAPLVSGGHGGDTRLAEAALRRAGVRGVRLVLHSDFPIGAGLGGSSAAGVAAVGALAAWQGEDLERGELAERSREIEVDDLGIAGGRQDHYAASFGGALLLRFGDGVEVEPIPLAPSLVEAIERRCLVFYTGRSRISAETITGVLDAYRRGDDDVTTALARMRGLAEVMARALGRGDLDELGMLVGEHWAYQRQLHAGIPTPLIDEIVARARRLGAHGAKALGASGGGCVLVVAPDERADEIRDGITSLARPVPFRVDEGGFALTDDEPFAEREEAGA